MFHNKDLQTHKRHSGVQWQINALMFFYRIILKPRARPLESLAIALCNDQLVGKGQKPAELIQQFKQNERELHWLGQQAMHDQPESYSIVLLVDQFEEIFTLCHDEQERQVFIDNLLTAATDGSGQVIVLFTLRTDFYDKCAAYSQLAGVLRNNSIRVDQMTKDQLRRSINEPAFAFRP